MRVERLFARHGGDPLARAVRHDPEALLVVHEIGFHDLIEHMLMHGRVEQGDQRLDPPVEVALHQVG